jgi:tetratricopeptide (TPR) repeat protein
MNILKKIVLFLFVISVFGCSQKTAEDYKKRGGVKREKEDYKGAIKDFSKAIELDPNYAEAYLWRGQAKNDIKDRYNAIEDYNKAIKLDPNFASAYGWRGNTKYELEDYHGALEDYNKAVKINPDYDKDYFWRGRAEEKLNKSNNARGNKNISPSIPKELIGKWYSSDKGYYITFTLTKDKIYLIAEGEEYSVLARVIDNKIETAALDNPDFKDANIFCTSYTLSNGVLTIMANADYFFSDPEDEYMTLSFKKKK